MRSIGLLLAPFFLLPTMWAGKGARWYWTGLLLSQAVGAVVCVAWLAAPFAFWKAFGFWWTLLWLVPTSAAVFSLAFAPKGGG